MSNVRRLPGPIADLWDWQRLGLCRGRDSAQFFHPDGERGSSRNRREAKAKTMCGACPVRGECAAHALAVREPYGVWGGFSEAERLRLLAVGMSNREIGTRLRISEATVKFHVRNLRDKLEVRRRTEHVEQAPQRKATAGILLEPELQAQPFDPAEQLLGR